MSKFGFLSPMCRAGRMMVRPRFLSPLRRAGFACWQACAVLLFCPAASARLVVPELPTVEGVNLEQGPIGVLEGIFVYFIYLLAAMSVAWVVLSVGRRVIGEFNAARHETGDFGRVILTAAVGIAIIMFIVFLANYLNGIIQR